MTTPRRQSRIAAARPAAAGPRWVVRTPAFEADAVCPLMPVWPWGGHRAWAYDLVRFMKPPVIAELGVHWGTSLFAFAQAVKDGRLASRMIGVDTWAGDEHTGPYGSEVLATVRRIAADHFPRQHVELLQMTFDDALARVADASIDLLHIDGFHEFDAVKHDFESWLPKLAPDGVVLLHDVAEATGYGSARYWRLLNDHYPGFSFNHSWGLGVVFPKGPRWLRALERQNLKDKLALYTYRALHERATIELRDTGEMAVSRLAAMDSMEGIIKDRDSEIGLLKSIVGDRDAEIRLLKGFVSDRDAALERTARENGALRSQAAELAAGLSSLRERAEHLEQDLQAATAIADRVTPLEAEVGRQTARAAAAETSLAQRTSEVRSLGADLATVQGNLQRTTDQLAAALARAREMEADAQSLRATIAVLTSERDHVTARLGVIEERHALIAADMHAMTARLAAECERSSALRAELAENNAMNERLRTDLQRVEADIEMLALRVEQLERLEIEREELAADRPGREPRSAGRSWSSPGRDGHGAR